jgi:hypothetical protein
VNENARTSIYLPSTTTASTQGCSVVCINAIADGEPRGVAEGDLMAKHDVHVSKDGNGWKTSQGGEKQSHHRTQQAAIERAT